MHGFSTSALRKCTPAGALTVLTGFLAVIAFAGAAGTGSAAVDAAGAKGPSPAPTITSDVAHDLSPPLRDLAAGRIAPEAEDPAEDPERGPIAAGKGNSADGARQAEPGAATIPATSQNFEGLSNEDNFNILGRRVN